MMNFSLPLLAIATLLFSYASATAQLIPDHTLGQENYTVTNQGMRKLITGGAIRNENLFHSFQEFNVSEGQQVYFNNPNGIANIFTRVTGSNLSKIFGTLGVNGSANLFLLNPNGIIFGKNAHLDVASSFSATTANEIFVKNYEFSAVNPQLPLLKINITPGLQYGTINANSEIQNQGILTVGNGQNLTLILKVLEARSQLPMFC